MWIADLGNGNYRNPILYTDYSDPDAIRVGGDYYMIASSFCNAPAIPVLHSKDLVNWKVINYVLKEIPEFRYRNPIHGCGVWAPAIRYHEGTFYACFPMPDEGIYMSTTKDPYGEWSKPVNIRPGAGWIDPCPFWDEDGKAYLVAGVAKSRIGYKSVLHMVEMSSDGMSLIGEEKVVFDGNLNDQVTIEGPKLYKRNGYYYIWAPAGGVKTGWQTVLRSKNIYGPYEYKMVLRQGDTKINGPHQGAWVDTVTGEDWFLHFQDVYAAGRITHLQPVMWENDWPIIGQRVGNEEYGVPVLEYRKPNVSTDKSLNKSDIFCPELDDEFESDSLGLQWQWNANYEKDWVECRTNVDGTPSEDGSWLRLNAVDTTNKRPVGDYRNLLLQKWAMPEFTCVTKMNINNIQPGDFAGCVSLGMKYSALGFKRSEEGLKLVSVLGEQSFDCDQAYTKEQTEEKKFILPEDGTVYFRYTVKCVGSADHTEGGLPVFGAPVEEITLEVSSDGKVFDNSVTIPAKAGRWVGVKNGMFISHDNSVKNSERGFVTVDYVRYE